MFLFSFLFSARSRNPFAAPRLLCAVTGGVLLALPRPGSQAQTPPVTPAAPPAVAAPAVSVPAASVPPSAAPAALPAPLTPASVRIETFGPERGFVVGAETVGLLCVVRNAGATALPADALRLRCYPISGLDYTSGNLLPVLPSLAPGQAVAYRWRLAQSDAKTVLAAGVVLERRDKETRRQGDEETKTDGTGNISASGRPEQGTGNTGASAQQTTTSGEALPSSPLLAFAIIPRLPHQPGFGDVPILKDALPRADSRDGVALLLNNRVGARVQTGAGRDPLMQLAVRDAGGWHVLASTLPLLRANVGEDGQNPWWQSFRCQSVRVREDKEIATLTLNGTLGSSCRVEITFEARADTCVVSGRARLTATHPLRLSGVQLPALLAGGDDKNGSAPRQDGSPNLLADTPSPLPDDARIAAAHTGAFTFGIAWPADPPRPNWRWTRLPTADGAYTQNLGVQALYGADGDLVSTGSSVDFAFRLFAFAPSDTVRDALRFQLP